MRWVVRTVKIALARQRQTPAGVLGQGVEHVVEEADARVHADGLRLARLARVALADGRHQSRIGIRRELPTIEVQGELDLGLVRVADECGPPLARFLGTHGRSFAYFLA